MDNVTQHRETVKQVLKEHAQYKPAYGDIEVQTIFDTEGDHYQLVHVGWNKKRRQYGPLIHIDLKDGKIWIQHDGTEVGIANKLVDLGVPREEIVLGYFSPFMRQHSDFAVA